MTSPQVACAPPLERTAEQLRSWPETAAGLLPSGVAFPRPILKTIIKASLTSVTRSSSGSMFAALAGPYRTVSTYIYLLCPPLGRPPLMSCLLGEIRTMLTNGLVISITKALMPAALALHTVSSMTTSASTSPPILPYYE